MKKEGLFSYWHYSSWNKYQDIIRLFGSLDNACSASRKALEKLHWRDTTLADFILWRNNINEAECEEILSQESIECISYNDEEYPEPLRHLPDPPLALFIRGSLSTDAPHVGVVGTRLCTSYGTRVTKEIVRELVEHGVVVVSGLAYGIDASAHRACIDHGGKTIAVLGGSVDKHAIHPREHTQLAEEIIKSGGAVISEHPPGYEPHKRSFVIRNRIIAGLSKATIVTEAPQKSGALITAQVALDIGREVCAIPHAIHSKTGEGCNELLRQGAHCIYKADQITELLGLQISKKYDTNTSLQSLTEDEQSILSILSKKESHIDELSEVLHIPSSKILSAIMQLEIKGIVKHIGSMEYVVKY